MNIWCKYTEIRDERCDETAGDFCDQSGAAEALWAYPTGPKIEDAVQGLITWV